MCRRRRKTNSVARLQAMSTQIEGSGTAVSTLPVTVKLSLNSPAFDPFQSGSPSVHWVRYAAVSSPKISSFYSLRR